MPNPPRRPGSSSRDKLNGHVGGKPSAKPKSVAPPWMPQLKKSRYADPSLQRWMNICDALIDEVVSDYDPPDISDEEVSRMRERLGSLTKAALGDHPGPLPETPQETIAKLRAEVRVLARAYVRKSDPALLEQSREYVSRIWKIERAEGLRWSHPEMEFSKAFRELRKTSRKAAAELMVTELKAVELALESIPDVQKPKPRKRREK